MAVKTDGRRTVGRGPVASGTMATGTMASGPSGTGRLRPDCGAATVWVLAAGLLTVLVALAASTVGSAIVARHAAQGAADLAALAGAARAVEGESVACARAGQVAAANHADLVACRLDGWDLVVTTRVVPSGPAAVAGTASASARAGPLSPPG